jgi:hypothetical protein
MIGECFEKPKPIEVTDRVSGVELRLVSIYFDHWTKWT